jgi:hypothetical protein
MIAWRPFAVRRQGHPRKAMMRALGPGSVSSLLKVILDVIHFALWAAGIVASAGIVIALLLSISPELSDSRIVVGDIHIEGAWLGPLLAAVLLAVILNFSGAIIIVGRLRRISETLVAGDPFTRRMCAACRSSPPHWRDSSLGATWSVPCSAWRPTTSTTSASPAA